jgi:molybdate transport system substrate-binding protein
VLALAVTLGPAVGRADDRPRLRVLAAASLTDVVEGLASAFQACRIEVGVGGSSVLARQIRDGAPADVFLSASPDWMEALSEARLLDGVPAIIARNRLVCIAPAAGGLSTGDAIPGPAELLARITADGRVAIADPGVPAGEYARAALDSAGLLESFERRLVGQPDVRAVLRAVELGEMDAGFVYATDAAIADVTVLFVFDAKGHPPIEYQAAVLRASAEPEAVRRFLQFLRGDPGRAILEGAGFVVP